MFRAAVRYFSTKPKPKKKPIELRSQPEQTQSIRRAIFDIVKEHGPLTVSETWERVQEVGLRGLKGKSMKIVLRWMRERQKLRLICNHVGVSTTISLYNLVYKTCHQACKGSGIINQHLSCPKIALLLLHFLAVQIMKKKLYSP